jgi:hypothetical protein
VSIAAAASRAGGSNVNLERGGVLIKGILQKEGAKALVARVDLHSERTVFGSYIAIRTAERLPLADDPSGDVAGEA